MQPDDVSSDSDTEHPPAEASQWFGQGKKMKDVPGFVRRIVRDAFEIPLPVLDTLLPAPTLSIPEMLAFPVATRLMYASNRCWSRVANTVA